MIAEKKPPVNAEHKEICSIVFKTKGKTAYGFAIRKASW